MKPNATRARKRRYVKVTDGRNQPIRGLWKTSRTGQYYAQIQSDGKLRMVPLNGADTRADAVKELNKLRDKRDKGELVVVRSSPKLSQAIADFKREPAYKERRSSTRRNLETYFKLWEAKLGDKSVKLIRKADILEVRRELRNEGVAGFTRGPVGRKTGNHYVEALVQVLKFCEENERLAVLPRVRREKKPKDEDPVRVEIIDDVQFRRLLAACDGPVVKRRMVRDENGRTAKRFAGKAEKLNEGSAAVLKSYLRFLALTGAREREALAIRWDEVDFERKIVAITKTKNGKARNFNFSPELENLLTEMHEGRPPDSSYLFPSPQRGSKDIAATTLRESFNAVRLAAGLPWFAFHGFRHLFISKCVMAGVDFKTIAEWVGHSDGGVLIGKVYSHLTEDHKAQIARNLCLFERPGNITQIAEAAGA
jgi:integrase